MRQTLLSVLFVGCLVAQAQPPQPRPPKRPADDPKLGRKLASIPTETAVNWYPDRVRSLALAPNGKTLALASHRETYLVSFPNGKVIHKLSPGEGWDSPYWIRFTPDGKQLVTYTGGLQVWDTKTGKQLLAQKWPWIAKDRLIFPDRKPTLELPALTHPYCEPALSTDGKRMFVAGPKEELSIYDTATGKELPGIREPGGRVTSISVSPDGKYVAAGTYKGFSIWTIATRERVAKRTLTEQPELLRGYHVFFTPDSKRLLVFGSPGDRYYNEFLMWDVAEKDIVSRAPTASGQHFPTRGGFIGENRYFVADERVGLGIYDLKDGSPVGRANLNWNAAPLVLTPDGKHFLGGAGSSEVVTIKVEDILKVIAKDDKPPKKQP